MAATNTGNGRTLVYVLNEDSETLDGFTLDRNGQLTYIPGSDRAITGGTFSASVAFDPSGHVLTVTNRNDPFFVPSGTISTFTVDPSTGLLGSEVVTKATGTGAPFGLDYTNRDQLLVANAGEFVGNGASGSATSYGVDKQSGAVTPISQEFSGPLSITCWVRVTKNNRYAYFTNPGNGAINGYGITADGALVPIGSTPVPAETATTGQIGEGSPLDLDYSVDGRYLYVLVTNINLGTLAFGNSRIAEYYVNSDGSLSLIGVTPAGAGGNSGLAAY